MGIGEPSRRGGLRKSALEKRSVFIWVGKGEKQIRGPGGSPNIGGKEILCSREVFSIIERDREERPFSVSNERLPLHGGGKTF